MQEDDTAITRIKLISSDKKEFILDKEAFRQSGTICDYISIDFTKTDPSDMYHFLNGSEIERLSIVKTDHYDNKVVELITHDLKSHVSLTSVCLSTDKLSEIDSRVELRSVTLEPAENVFKIVERGHNVCLTEHYCSSDELKKIFVNIDTPLKKQWVALKAVKAEFKKFCSFLGLKETPVWSPDDAEVLEQVPILNKPHSKECPPICQHDFEKMRFEAVKVKKPVVSELKRHKYADEMASYWSLKHGNRMEVMLDASDHIIWMANHPFRTTMRVCSNHCIICQELHEALQNDPEIEMCNRCPSCRMVCFGPELTESE